MTKKRLRNYGMWTSLVSLLAVLSQAVLVAVGVMDAQSLVEPWIIVANTVLAILSTLGIVSNPTKPDGQGYNL